MQCYTVVLDTTITPYTFYKQEKNRKEQSKARNEHVSGPRRRVASKTDTSKVVRGTTCKRRMTANLRI